MKTKKKRAETVASPRVVRITLTTYAVVPSDWDDHQVREEFMDEFIDCPNLAMDATDVDVKSVRSGKSVPETWLTSHPTFLGELEDIDESLTLERYIDDRREAEELRQLDLLLKKYKRKLDLRNKNKA